MEEGRPAHGDTKEDSEHGILTYRDHRDGGGAWHDKRGVIREKYLPSDLASEIQGAKWGVHRDNNRDEYMDAAGYKRWNDVPIALRDLIEGITHGPSEQKRYFIKEYLAFTGVKSGQLKGKHYSEDKEIKFTIDPGEQCPTCGRYYYEDVDNLTPEEMMKVVEGLLKGEDTEDTCT